MKKWWLSGVVLLLLFSCSTIPYGQRPENIKKVIALFNSGDVKALVADSSLPFLFGGEIVELKEDLTTMWTNLVGSGLRFSDAQVVESHPVTETTYKAFVDSLEGRVFMSRYLPKETSFVRVKCTSGTFDFLLDGSQRGYPLILGFKEETPQ